MQKGVALVILGVWIHLFGGANEAYSQNVSEGFYHEEITIEDGLPVNTITDVEFTEEGYLWISTHGGLLRYEGLVRSGSKPYSEFNMSNTKAFKEDRLLSLFKSPKGELYILTGQINKRETIVRYKDQSFEYYGEDKILKLPFNSFSFDEEGNLWALSNQKLYTFQDEEWIPKFQDLDLSDFKGNVHIEILSENDIWINSRSSKRLARIKSGNLYPIIIPELKDPRNIITYYNDPDGTQWLATSEGLFTISRDDPFTVRNVGIEVPINAVQDLLGDPMNPERFIYRVGQQYYVFYKGEYQKIYEFNEDERGAITQKIIGPENSGWLVLENKIYYNNQLAYQGDEKIRGFTTDKSGAIWFVTRGTLNQLKETIFDSYTLDSHGIENVYPIYEDSKGNYWISVVPKGVFKYDGKNFEYLDEKIEISIKRTFSISEDDSGAILFGSTKGLFRWKEGEELEKIYLENGQDFEPVRAIYEDKSRRLWAAGSDYVYLNETGKWNSFRLSSDVRAINIRFIYEDKEGVIWFGGRHNGLFYFDELTQDVKPFAYNHLLAGKGISMMYQDSEGIYWVGSSGLGLNRLEFNIDRKTAPKVTSYNKESGLLGLTLHAVLEDDYGRFWISSNSGIFQVHRQSLNDYAYDKVSQINSTIYDLSDGLPGIEANGGMQSTAIEDRYGRFWFAMIKGIAVIDPAKVINEDRSVAVKIEKLTTPDSVYSVIKEEVELLKEERNLHLEFIGYNHDVKASNIKFRHILEGYDDSWTAIGNSYDAYYTGVPAGEYNFRVQATVFGSDWEDTGVSLKILIEPYYYETAWFRLLVILAGLLLIAGIFQWRIYQVKFREKLLQQKVDEQTKLLAYQADKLKELDQAKSKFFTNVSHELRTPLTLIMGPLNDLKEDSRTNGVNDLSKKNNKIDLALKHTNRLLRLVNQILDISKLESNSMKMHVSNIDICVYLEEIIVAFSGLAERQNIQLEFHPASSHIPLYVDQDMIEKIFVNLISNAFKFTPQGGKIEIVIEENDQFVTIKVRDTGKGIEEQELPHVFDRFYHTSEPDEIRKTGAGIGLALVKELVEKHNGEIEVVSKPNFGTIFSVKMKKGKDHLKDYSLLQQPLQNGQKKIIPTAEEDIHSATEIDLEEYKSDDLKTALLIDDNADIRNYIKSHLKDYYRVLEAGNGAMGLKMAQDEIPDIIICDVLMPKMDGFEVCRALKNNIETDFIPVILLTAKSQREDKLDGLEFGADDYIIKPFDIEELKIRAKNLITSRKVLMDKYASKNYKFEVSNIEVESEEQIFLDALKAAIEEHMSDEDFGVEELAGSMAINRVTLHNKLKKLVKQTPSEVIKEFRLQQAHQLLTNNAGNISEIAYSVGFKSVSHFSRAFKNKYKSSPSKFKG